MECVPQPDFGQRHTQPAGDPWPDLADATPGVSSRPPCDNLGADVAFIGTPFNQDTVGRPGARSQNLSTISEIG